MKNSLRNLRARRTKSISRLYVHSRGIVIPRAWRFRPKALGRNVMNAKCPLLEIAGEARSCASFAYVETSPPCLAGNHSCTIFGGRSFRRQVRFESFLEPRKKYFEESSRQMENFDFSPLCT